jgi:hypothetical protein
MQDRHIFDDMENIVKQMKNGKFWYNFHIIIPSHNIYCLDYPTREEDDDLPYIPLWDVNGKTNFPGLIPSLKTQLDDSFSHNEQEEASDATTPELHDVEEQLQSPKSQPKR